MKITDIYGKKSTVTDLDQAIDQAENFMGFDSADGPPDEYLQERKRYWTDIYEKLTHLKSLQNKGNHGSK
ncbi:hypothetical protein [Sphingobacterium hotanense]|uniref:hypothetical protein n=1 Tax=Sphingobacterium hotanense TaxID=649196 RepID=UPI0021A2A636|nr:hypothetical protein [Sphingobacterium hotanense]MCT1526059.1 hypothetical protein [Sphingobacterium hotanense]